MMMVLFFWASLLFGVCVLLACACVSVVHGATVLCDRKKERKDMMMCEMPYVVFSFPKTSS